YRRWFFLQHWAYHGGFRHCVFWSFLESGRSPSCVILRWFSFSPRCPGRVLPASATRFLKMDRASLRAHRPVLRGTPVLVGIAGGSGSGKTWLADKLMHVLAPHAVRLALDDFYRDRSHLPMLRRARLNFDHPSAIDWRELRHVLQSLLSGRETSVVSYNFKT